MPHARTAALQAPDIALRITILAAIALFCLALPVGAQQQAAEPDGLVRVRTERFDAAYLAPGADFSGYTTVMLDPTEASFARNWLRDYNRDVSSLDRRLSEDEAREMLQTAQTAFHEMLTEAYRAGGYEVVTTPAPDVVRLRTALANVRVSAPDVMSAGRVRTFSSDAGEAVLILEARDSMSGALLGRGFDRRTIDDNMRLTYRDSVSNRSDFRRVFRRWADMSVEALNKLKTTPAPAAAG
jgi:hypothetical protein